VFFLHQHRVVFRWPVL